MTQQICVFSPHVMEFKRVLDSGFHAVDPGFQVLDSSLCQRKLGFWIPMVSGIPDSLSCIFGILRPRIPDSTSKMFPDSGLNKQKDSLTWGEFLITQ